jgi:hypothetical protein
MFTAPIPKFGLSFYGKDLHLIRRNYVKLLFLSFSNIDYSVYEGKVHMHKVQEEEASARKRESANEKSEGVDHSRGVP